MRTMLDFAMILSFTTTPIFAFLNYKLVRSTKLPKRASKWDVFKYFVYLWINISFWILILFIIYRWFPFLIGL